MYGLLIVDDEYQARHGLRDLIDWQSLGIRVLGDAEDGDEALPMLKALRPDILLTDIRMHRMDGLTLAREARKCLPGIEIVFISGYSDSDYLRDALRVDAFDYLYKPVRIEELQRLMQSLVQRLDARAQAARQMEKSRVLLEKSKPLLIERFLRSWIRGMLQDAQALHAQLELLELTIPAGTGVTAIALQPEWPRFPSDGQAEAYLVLLEAAARQVLQGALICAEETGLVALAPSTGTGPNGSMAEALRALSDRMRGVTDAQLLIGVSRRHADWTEVPDAAREAQQAVERRMFGDEHTIFIFAQSDAPTAPGLARSDRDTIDRHLLAGDFDALWGSIEGMLHTQEEAGGGVQQVRKLLMAAALQADLTLEQAGLEGIDALAFCRQALAHRPIAPVKGALHAALSDACGRMRRRQETAHSPAVAQVLQIIGTQYAQRLSVDAIAGQVHYSPAHLSTLFRQETGITIGEALFRARLSAAMELLRTTPDPVSRIAQRSGYTDVQYFSRVFKRYTGITPLEYRRGVPPC